MQALHGDLDILQPVNTDCPLTRGLVSWWLANDGIFWGGPKCYDLMGRNHGALTGPTWGGALGRPGGWGSLNFDGSDDYVNCGQNASLDITGSQITLGAWINYRDGAPNFNRIIEKSGGYPNLQYSLVVEQTTGKPIFDLYRSGLGSYAVASTALTPVWTHILATYDGANRTFYRNGIQDGQTATTGDITSVGSYATLIGDYQQSPGIQYALEAGLDDVRIWNRSISAADAIAIYNDSLRGYPQTLNWIRRATVFDMGGGAPPATNRRRRLLICGAAA